MKKNDIVICGGHVTPAIAVIEYCHDHKIPLRFHYIGRKHTLEGDKSESFEYKEISSLGIPFHSLIAGRLQRSFSPYTIFSLLKVPIGLVQSFIFLLRIRPGAVLSFGSYVALPICVSAWFLGIPIITHEQTRVLGISNRLIARLARVLCLSWPDTRDIPTSARTLITGNPVRQSLQRSISGGLINFGNVGLPLIYVTGGSQGARPINLILNKIIDQLADGFRVLHQCGSTEQMRDYELLSKTRQTLGEKKENYKVIPHIESSEVGSVMKGALLIISRAGANTVSEIATVGIPAILIPLPHAGGNEQWENAHLLEEYGAAVLISQDSLTPAGLLETIALVKKQNTSMRKSIAVMKRILPPDAEGALVKIMRESMQGTT